jgi:hypothetical protein
MKMTVVGVLACVFIAVNVPLAQAGDAPSTSPPRSLEPDSFSIGAEALLWWMKDSSAPPPLVSTGILGQPGTTVLLGGEDLNTHEHPGLRVTAGYWGGERWGLEASGFYLPSRSVSHGVSSSGAIGSQDLSIPFVDVTLPGESITGLSVAGRFSGEAREELSARLLGAELHGAVNLAVTAASRVDLLGGFRYVNLRENFAFTTSSPNVAPRPPDVFQTKDRFETTNNFYGGQVGVRARSGWGSWKFNGTAKLALGAMVQSVDIDGFVLTNDFNGFGEPQKFAGGYFAQPTNIGTHTRTAFAVIPEVGLNAGYDVTHALTFFLGYTFLYTNTVVRPGDQIDRGINPTQNASFGGTPPTPLVGPARPAFQPHGSSFWAQGLNAGVALRF